MRLSENLFLVYFRKNKSITYKVQPLSLTEKNYWLNNKNIIKNRQNYDMQTEKKCYIAFEIDLNNIYDVITILTLYNSVFYISPNFKYISSSCKGENCIVYTETKSINYKDYYDLNNFENIMFSVNNVKNPDISIDLDEYQIIDRSLVNYEKYMSHIGQAMVTNCISLQFSRGCTFNCAYCQKVYLGAYRNRSADNLFSEIEMYYKIGVKRFAFIDDLPNFNRTESIKLFKMIYEHKMNIQLFFPNGLRGDILDPEYIDYMVQAGTVNIDLALETASPRLQKLINKNLNLEKLNENILYIISNHPHVILELQMMIGLPTESCEESIKSINFINSLKWIDFPYMHVLKIFPNTPMAKLALENGISIEDIYKSNDLAYHELPDTLPFSKLFAKKCQSKLLNMYILDKNRLNTVLPKQANIMTEQEIIKKYDSYLPFKIQSIKDITALANLTDLKCKNSDKYEVAEFNKKIQSLSLLTSEKWNKYKILFLDLTLHFDECAEKLYHVIEPPIGQIYILSYLNKKLGNKIEGKIMKSGIDFKAFEELKVQIEKFEPDFIAIRGMNYYKFFLHYTVSLIRQWGYSNQIAIGGPYATSSYNLLLGDTNIDFAIIGEGEETLLQLINKFLIEKNPDLSCINGIAYRKSTIEKTITVRWLDYIKNKE